MKQKGFTLIELLVVISIIGLLSSVVLASLNTARAKARDAQRISIAIQIGKANELRFSNIGTYAPTRGWLSNSGALAGMNSDLSPFITATIPSDDLSRYLYVVKDWQDSNPSSFRTCITSGGWVPTTSRYALYMRLDNPQTSSSNYITSTSGGDVYDRCMAQVRAVNYRVGN